MSAINLSGNASGSGTFTIASPNSNTNYTLALPEEAGTITTSNSPYSTFRNRIINGDMRIDQRNAGASVTPSTDSTYTLDRWFIRNTSGAGRFSVIQSSTSSANFPISALLTNTTTAVPGTNEFYGFGQNIEGYNISDFGWGTANAKDITISFRVRSSLTGTYCVSVRNSDATRSFVAEFSIDSADTFETKSVTIPGETSGSWGSTTSAALLLLFCLGSSAGREGTAGSWQTTNIVGTSNQVDWINTSGATFYITGVQLEVGSVATPFERRPYGTEFMLCQRYFQKSYNQSVVPGTASTSVGQIVIIANNSSYGEFFQMRFPVTMRASPTMVTYNPSSGASGSIRNISAGSNVTASINSAAESGLSNLDSTLTSGSVYTAQYTASAEL